jgi:hypothetical protein
VIPGAFAEDARIRVDRANFGIGALAIDLALGSRRAFAAIDGRA